MYDFWDAAQFGDSFGAANALFAGLAFAGVIIALYLQRHEFREEQSQNREVMEMQRQELELRRKELELTRQELQRSADVQEATEKTVGLTAYLVTARLWSGCYAPSNSLSAAASQTRRIHSAKSSPFAAATS